MKIEKFKYSILEKRNIKDYQKYSQIIKYDIYKFYDERDIEKLVLYKENDSFIVEIKTWNGVNFSDIEIFKNYFGDFDECRINPANGSQLILIFSGIHEEFIKKLDREIELNKYNL